MTKETKGVESRIRVREIPKALRAGGENIPLEYPHLYQIQAGDWRISYAVEHNRLAILVLEVLNREDAEREKMAKKMKVKLMDWAEDNVGAEVPPEELGKKLKIKLLDLTAEPGDQPAAASAKPRVKLGDKRAENVVMRSRVKLLPTQTEEETGMDETTLQEGKITPLNSPSWENSENENRSGNS